MTGKRTLLAAVLAVLVAAAAITALIVRSDSGSPAAHHDAHPHDGEHQTLTDDAQLRERFAFLSKQRTNRCTLTGAEVMTMPAAGVLRGSCCQPMDYATYRGQRSGLARYANVAEIPHDGYDIPAALAQRLLRYRSIALDAKQEAALARAMRLDGHGPCCCQCWRWDAFEGQARFLIVRRGFSARQVADVWLLEDGCGGSHDHDA